MLAITGAAMITSLGTNKDACFEAFCEAHTGDRPLRGFDPEKFSLKHACEIPDRTSDRDVKGRATKWLCAAITQALEMSRISTVRTEPGVARSLLEFVMPS